MGRHRRTHRGEVEAEQAIIDHVRARGVASPSIIPTLSGERVLEHAGHFYSLFEHAVGVQVERTALNGGLARAMGQCLAGIHLALVDFRVIPKVGPPAPPPSHVILDRIPILLDRVRALDEDAKRRRWAQERLESHAAWLSSGAASDVPPVPDEPVQFVHGDYHEGNVFFADGHVASVIDWDRAGPNWPAIDAVRALDLALDVNPGLCAPFLDGYRSRRELPTEVLDAAADCYSFYSAHDLWLYETLYIAGDNRVRRFLRPGPFVPFAESWAVARAGFS